MLQRAMGVLWAAPYALAAAVGVAQTAVALDMASYIKQGGVLPGGHVHHLNPTSTTSTSTSTSSTSTSTTTSSSSSTTTTTSQNPQTQTQAFTESAARVCAAVLRTAALLGIDDPEAIAVFASGSPVSASGGCGSGRFIALAAGAMTTTPAGEQALRDPSDPVVAFAIAHELGHLAQHHPAVSIAATSASIAVLGHAAVAALRTRRILPVLAWGAAVSAALAARKQLAYEAEFRADAAAASIGLGPAGVVALDAYASTYNVRRDAWGASHPSIEARTARLAAAGSPPS